MTADPQQSLLDKARQGDGEALGELLQGFRPYVRMLVHGLRAGRVSSRLDDSDLIQDALLEAHRGFSSFHGRTVAELTAWLRTIVIRSTGRTLRQHLGTGMREVGREEMVRALDILVSDASTPSQQAVRHEQTARLAECLARLPDDMQQVLLGRHVDQASYAELAERLGRTEAAVRVLYTRALRRLREECGAE
jgi:RNA polymerase sigma-70 factor, ECF subfamily